MGFSRICLPRRRRFHKRYIFFVLVVAISSSLLFIVHLLLYSHLRRSLSDPAKPQLALCVFENSTRQQTHEVVLLMARNLIPLPACPYNPSFLVRGKIPKYGGWWRIKESLVFPQDDTDMLSRGSPWSWFQPSPLINKTRLESIVNKLMTSLRSR